MLQLKYIDWTLVIGYPVAMEGKRKVWDEV